MAKVQNRPASARPWRRLAGVAALAGIVGMTDSGGSAAQPRGPSVTTRAAAGPLKALSDALLGFDEEARRSNGRPANAQSRVGEIERAVPAATAEIQSFVGRLRQAREVEAFEQLVYARAAESGRPTLAAEIRAEGGPVALLERAGTLLPALVAERRQAAAVNRVDGLLERVGLTTSLRAGVLTTACGGFFFALSLGYGERFAYRACYY